MKYFRTREQWKAHRERIEQSGIRLAPVVRPLGGDLYQVPSESTGGFYQVDLSKETCQCRYWQEQNDGEPKPQPPVRCKHVIAAKHYANGDVLDIEPETPEGRERPSVERVFALKTKVSHRRGAKS